MQSGMGRYMCVQLTAYLRPVPSDSMTLLCLALTYNDVCAVHAVFALLSVFPAGAVLCLHVVV